VLRGTIDALIDLVMPRRCAGCDSDGGQRDGLCRWCVAALCSVTPQRTRPDPEPRGLPATYALAGYDGTLREALLRYKERGRHELATVLGERLAAAVLSGRAVHGGPVPVLVPIPATATAARQRHGDHMLRLAHRASAVLREHGIPAAVAPTLRALAKPDSTALDARQRAQAAADAFTTRRRRLPALRDAVAAGASVVLVDDIITTGSTLVAASLRLERQGVPVAFAAVLAATQRHHGTPT
jgi:predicted amidophosphoribosyltransferase